MKLLYKILLLVFLSGLILYNPFIGIFGNNNADKTKLKYFSPDDKKCTFCHSDIIKHKILHVPAEDDCESCHQSTGNKHPRVKLKGFTLTEKMPELCYMCHESKTDKKYVHQANKNGKCNTCHSPHGSEYANLLPKPTSSEMCAKCHNLNLKKNIHAPIELDGCNSCHDSHQSDYPNLLLKEKSELCSSCHDNIKTEKKAEFLHAPFDDDCFNCHTAHSSDKAFLLTESTPGLCYTCHDDIQTKLTKSKTVHQVAKDTKNCRNCHSPHASSHSNILLANENDLCFKCHNKKIISGTDTIENIKEKLTEAQYKHAPLEDGCNSCHDPHGSDNNYLLIASFPSDEYAKASTGTFELCFNCHDADLLNQQFSETATNFRNGNRNLHYTHINGKKGRNCNICHDVHASKTQFLIKQKSIFGTWEMPMNFRVLKNGGSCRTGCHEKKEYDRINPIKYKNASNNANPEKDIDTKKTTNNDSESKPESLPDENKNSVEKKDDFTKLTENKEDTLKNQTTGIEDTLNSIKKEQTIIEEKKADTIKAEITKKPSASEAFKKIMPLQIFFKFGNTEPAKNTDNVISKLIVFMKTYPDAVIEIGGHTDSVGKDSYNLLLSKRRAEAVKNILTAKGILPKRIRIKGYGEQYPVDTNKTEKGRSNNRRTEIKLINN